jgi:hypothetical protein
MKSNILILASLIAAISALTGSAPAAAVISVSFAESPVIFWASDPVRPDETILAQGDLLDGDTKLQIAELQNKNAGNPDLKTVDFSKTKFTSLSSMQPSAQTAKYLVPADWEHGIYAIRPVRNGEFGKTTILNAPQLWWIQGDQVKSSSTGGEYRIFGKCLSYGNAKVFLKDKESRFTEMKILEQDMWHIAIDLGNLIVGTYRLFVHNGLGGEYGWVDFGDLPIIEKGVWPQNIFNVVDYGAKPNFDPSRSRLDNTNDSPAFQLALNAAGKNGGGVVYIPRGCYRLVEELNVPRFVTMRGESQLSTNLGWIDREIPLAGLINGTNNFAVENLTIFVQNYQSVIRGDHGHKEGSGNIAVRGVAIRANRFLGVTHRDFKDWEAEYTRRLWNPKDREAALNFGGENIEIRNNDIDASHSSLILDKASGVVSHNKLYCPNSPQSQYWIRGCSNLIMENNDISGGGCLGTHNTSRDPKLEGGWNDLYLNTFSRNIYFSKNKLMDNWKYDREMMTLDSHGYNGPYLGPVAEAKGNTLVFPEPFPVLAVSGDIMSKSGQVCSQKKLGEGKYYKILVKMEAKEEAKDWDRSFINFYDGDQVIEGIEPEQFERNGNSREYGHGKVSAIKISGKKGFEVKEVCIAKSWKELLDKSSAKPVFANVILKGNDTPTKETGAIFDFDSNDVLYVLATVKAQGPLCIGKVELLKEDGKVALDMRISPLSGPNVDFNNIPKSPAQHANNFNLYKGAFVYVLEGKGCGQYRKIIDGKGNTLVFDKQWDVELDETSVVSVHRSHDHTIFVNNEFSDGGIALQIYGGGVENIIANNTATRAGGFVVTGLDACPSMYCQFIDNTIVTGAGLGGPPFNLRGGRISVEPYIPNGYLNGYQSIGIVMRGNRFENMSSATVAGPVQNVLVENNFFANTKTAIIVKSECMGSFGSSWYWPQDVFIRKNRIENVDTLLKAEKEATVTQGEK